MRTLKVTLEIKVDEDVPPGEPPETLDEYDARDVADVFTALDEKTGAELFGGSGIFAKFTECRVLDATWE